MTESLQNAGIFSSINIRCLLQRHQERELKRPRDAFILGLPFFLVLLAVYVLPLPLPLRYIPGDVDQAWQLLLADAFLRGAHFGSDVVLNYGPWGFIAHARGGPAIYPWLLVTRLLLACGLVMSTAAIATSNIASGHLRWIWMAAVNFLASPFAVLPILLVVTRLKTAQKTRTNTALLFVLILACALAAWMKFTVFVLVALLIVALGIQDSLEWRFPFVSSGLAATMIALWLAASQPISGLPGYIAHSASLAISHSGSMNADGPLGPVIGVTALLIIMVAASAIDTIKSGMRSCLPIVCWIALYFGANFKEAFTRYDGYHIWLGILDAFLPAALILLPGAGLWDRVTLARSAVLQVLVPVATGLTFSLTVLFLVIGLAGSSAGKERIDEVRWKVHSLLLLRSPSSVAEAYQRDLADYREKDPIRPVSGTVDFFPDNFAVLFAHGLKTRLRPDPQAYLAYNNLLTSMNATFLQGPKRPANVLFDVNSIDSRYPSLSDPLSVLALLRCYRPAGPSGRYLLLHPSACLPLDRKLLLDTNAGLDQRITVPNADSGLVWAEIDIDPGIGGRIATLLFHSPRLFLSAAYGSECQKFVITRELAQTGFLLSPVLSTPASFASLYKPHVCKPSMTVSAISISFSALAHLLIPSSVHVRLYELDIGYKSNRQKP